MSSGVRLADLAAELGADVVGDGGFEVRGVRPLDTATAGHLSFLHNPKYLDEAKKSEACAILDIGRNLYRKRLSRARSEVQAFTARSCGLASPAARCRCPRRLPVAVSLGRVDPGLGNVFPDAPAWEPDPETGEVEL